MQPWDLKKHISLLHNIKFNLSKMFYVICKTMHNLIFISKLSTAVYEAKYRHRQICSH